ncbi:MAG: ketoacyl-ACP synthase III [Muribaculaceae bacterium]|nr:ketoacyl-ACP synthase III [Muribaculaceae bacterium]
MAYLKIDNVKIAGISTAVPKKVQSNLGANSSEGVSYNADDFINTTGVRERRNDKALHTSDLCTAAAEKLIESLGWDKKEIDALILVTQTGDYILPATSCILQDRLGLSKECYCADLGLGCSGWVYGLSNIASMMQTGNIRKALLLVGDTGLFSPDDDLLFGSAGTATALEYEEGASPMFFNMGTDGSGYDAIIIPHGGAKHPFSQESLELHEIEGHWYNSIQSQMKGMDVFSFGITTAPKAVRNLAKRYGFEVSDADYLVLHQANKKMNDMIVKKLKFTPETAPISLDEFGNTSCASIPVTLVTRLSDRLRNGNVKIMACGFGVGLSWGAAFFETDGIMVPNLIEL